MFGLLMCEQAIESSQKVYYEKLLGRLNLRAKKHKKLTFLRLSGNVAGLVE